MNEEYTHFAAVYDSFMEEMPREKWAAFIQKKLNEYGIKDGLVLDLGCGTGVMTRMMSKLGYDMIGIDGSFEMLMAAREESDESILYLQQEFDELELYGTVAGVISTCDCINYIIDYDELVEVFRRVNNYLEKDGLFIFDIKAVYQYSQILGNNTFGADSGDSAYIWENHYEVKDRINYYGLTLFIEDEDGKFDRFYEEHVQRAYSLKEIKDALITAGMEYVAAFEDYSEVQLDEDRAQNYEGERITIIAKEGFQEGKVYINE